MPILFRPMRKDDKEAVICLMREFYQSPAVLSEGSDEKFHADVDYCTDDGFVYAEGYVFCHSEDENKLCGYSILAKSFSAEYAKPLIWIEDLYLAEGARGEGAGGRFLEFLESKYPDHILRLEVERSNVGAISLYGRCGFEKLEYLAMMKK